MKRNPFNIIETPLKRVKKVTDRIHFAIFGTLFHLRVEHDNVHHYQGDRHDDDGRIFIQVTYDAYCTKTTERQTWHGRKWYLSEHMTDDEIVKTCYAAFEAAVKHEVMEGFKVDGITLFNPHINFEALLAISNQEVFRK